MTNHTEALEAAILAAGFDPRNPAVLEAWQAGIVKYIDVRNGEAVAWMLNGNATANENAVRFAEEVCGAIYKPLFPAPVSAGGEKVKALEPGEFRRVHDAATAAYEAATPVDYRYSALALRKAVDAAISALSYPQQFLPDVQGNGDVRSIDAIMEQAQVFASTYSLVGGRFDDGSKMRQSDKEKAELRRLILTSLPTDDRKEKGE